MTLTSSSAIVRLFRWTELMKDQFFSRNYGVPRSMSDVNLCYFVRVLVFHLPLLVMTQLLFVVLPIAALVAPPLFFGSSWLVVPITGAVLIALFLGAVIVVATVSLLSDCIDRYRIKSVDTPTDKPPTTFDIAALYLRSKKQKICPMISFEEQS